MHQKELPFFVIKHTYKFSAGVNESNYAGISNVAHTMLFITTSNKIAVI